MFKFKHCIGINAVRGISHSNFHFSINRQFFDVSEIRARPVTDDSWIALFTDTPVVVPGM